MNWEHRACLVNGHRLSQRNRSRGTQRGAHKGHSDTHLAVFAVLDSGQMLRLKIFCHPFKRKPFSPVFLRSNRTNITRSAAAAAAVAIDGGDGVGAVDGVVVCLLIILLSIKWNLSYQMTTWFFFCHILITTLTREKKNLVSFFGFWNTEEYTILFMQFYCCFVCNTKHCCVILALN